MELNNLTAISPLDGRYRHKVDELDLSMVSVTEHRSIQGYRTFHHFSGVMGCMGEGNRQ